MASAAFLEKAYLAYFGRPVDATGAIAFQNATEAQVEVAFYNSAESEALYGTTFGADQINAIYNMLFGRDAEPAGIYYWLNEVVRGALTPAGAALGILNGALNDDATAVANKLVASAAFTAALDTTPEILGYNGDAAAASARDFLATVTTTPATQAEVDAAVAASTSVGGVPGETFTLTVGVDTVEGTIGTDEINAFAYTTAEVPATTLTTNDNIDGGAGIDTLNLYATAEFNRDLNGSVANVEKINVFGSDFVGTALNAGQLAAVASAETALTTAQDNLTTAQADLVAAQATLASATTSKNQATYAKSLIDAAVNAAAVNADPSAYVDGTTENEVAGDQAVILNAILSAINGVSVSATAVKAAAVTAANGVAAVVQADDNIDNDGAYIAALKTAILAATAGQVSSVTSAQDAAQITVNDLTDEIGDNDSLADSDLYAAVDASQAALDALVNANASDVDASYFEGSTHITVDGVVTGVTNVDGQVVSMTGANVNNSVSYAADVASGSIVLASRGTVTVEGADLAALSVSGSIKAVDADTDGTLNLVDNTEGGTVETLNLSLTNNGAVNVVGMDALTDVVSTGAGDLELSSDASVLNITTAGGDDVVGISTVTSATNEINATVSTGAGDDEIYVNTTGTGTTTVDAGVGDDLVYMARALNDNDSLTGGDGLDTLSIVNQDLDDDMWDTPETITAGTIARLGETVGFENLQFQNSVNIDASTVSNFAELQLAGEDNVVTKATADQAIVLQYSWGEDSITAAGYAASATTDAGKIANAGDLTIRAEEDQERVDLYADHASVTVDASEATEQYSVEIEDGILNSLSVDLKSSLNADGDDTEGFAYARVNAQEFAELSTVTITGQGGAQVDSSTNSDAETIEVDASGLVALLVNEGKTTEYNATYFQFYGDAGVQENVIVGDGSVDYIQAYSVIGDAQLSQVDTIEGLSFELNTAGTDYANGSDELWFEQFNLGTDYVAHEFTTVPSSLAAAVNTVSALSDNNVVFQFDDATYIYSEDSMGGVSANGDFEASDVLIKLVGTYDADQIVNVANINTND